MCWSPPAFPSRPASSEQATLPVPSAAAMDSARWRLATGGFGSGGLVEPPKVVSLNASSLRFVAARPTRPSAAASLLARFACSFTRSRSAPTRHCFLPVHNQYQAGTLACPARCPAEIQQRRWLHPSADGWHVHCFREMIDPVPPSGSLAMSQKVASRETSVVQGKSQKSQE